MKLLHTADWHVGKRLDRFSRIDEQRTVLEEIAGIADDEGVDLVIVAGDLYDTVNPGSEAEELLYTALSDLSADGARPVIAIAGNHDSPDRVLAPDVLARRYGIVLVGYPAATVRDYRGERSRGRSSGGDRFAVATLAPGLLEIRLAAAGTIPIRIITTPYANEYRLREACISEDRKDSAEAETILQEILGTHWSDLAASHLQGEGINLLVTHLFFADDPSSPPEEPEGERPIAHVGGAPPLSPSIVPEQVQYVACGHLHRPHTLGSGVPVRYAGSPLSYSFAEAGQQKSVTIVEVEPRGSLGSEAEIREVPLRSGYPLLRHTADDVPSALRWLEAHPDSYVELSLRLTDYLSGMDRNALHHAHPRVVSIVPIVEGRDRADGSSRVDPTEDTVSLFRRYFRWSTGVEAGLEILDLVGEILAAADSPDADRAGRNSTDADRAGRNSTDADRPGQDGTAAEEDE
ncbi:MAG: metallophosphoesterase family protein [Alkalispirochaeta sp.]